MVQKLYTYCSKLNGRKLYMLAALVLFAFIGAGIFDRQSRTPVVSANINLAALSLDRENINTWHSQLSDKQKLVTKKCDCKSEKFETNVAEALITRQYAARISLLLDLLMSAGLMVLMLRLLYFLRGAWIREKGSGRALKTGVWLVFIIFCAEIVEDLGLSYLTSYSGALVLNLVYFSTLIKLFSYILFLGLNLDFVSGFFSQIFNVLWSNLIQTFTMLLLYAIFFVSDQGQNLLINLNSNSIAVLVFLFIVSFFAALNWHISKFFRNKQIASDPHSWKMFYTRFDWPDLNKKTIVETEYQTARRQDYGVSVPRMFGVMVMLIPACALVNLTMLGNPSSLMAKLIDAHTIMFLSIVLFYYCFHKRLFERFFVKRSQSFMNIVMVMFLFAFVITGLLNDNSVWSIKFLALSLYLLALLFAIVTSVRNVKVRDTLRPFKFLGINLSEGRVNAPIFWISMGMVLCMLVIVVRGFGGPVLYDGLIFPVVSVIVVSYEIIVMFLVILKWKKRINFPVIALVSMLLIFSFINNNTYRLREGTELAAGEKIPDINQYIDEWLDARKPEIVKAKTNYPVFFVNGYGGGIRASAYFYMVIRELDAQYKDSLGESVLPHIFSFSTASGSSLGAVCAVADMARSQPMQLRDSASFNTFIQKDFLSPVLVGLLAGDAFSRFSDEIPDRDELQEMTWEKQDSFLKNNYFSLYAKNKRRTLPALLFNITESQSCQSVLLSPFDFDSTQMGGRICAGYLLGTRNINLSTAAILTARFPVISPAARTRSNNYFHDGGITENSGIKSNLEIYRAIKKRIAERISRKGADAIWLSKLRFHFLSVNNTMSMEDPPKEKLSQAGSLLKAVVGTGINGNSRRAVEETEAEAKNSAAFFYSVRVNENCIGIKRPWPWPQIIGDTLLQVKTILPLGWELSPIATQKLHRSAHQEVAGIMKKIVFFTGKSKD